MYVLAVVSLVASTYKSVRMKHPYSPAFCINVVNVILLSMVSHVAMYFWMSIVMLSTGVILGSDAADKFDSVTPDFKTTAGNRTAFEFTQLPVGVTKIRVYMWIEGQDIDCENTASGGQVKFNLGFTLNAPEPTATPESP